VNFFGHHSLTVSASHFLQILDYFRKSPCTSLHHFESVSQLLNVLRGLTRLLSNSTSQRRRLGLITCKATAQVDSLAIRLQLSTLARLAGQVIESYHNLHATRSSIVSRFQQSRCNASCVHHKACCERLQQIVSEGMEFAQDWLQ